MWRILVLLTGGLGLYLVLLLVVVVGFSVVPWQGLVFGAISALIGVAMYKSIQKSNQKKIMREIRMMQKSNTRQSETPKTPEKRSPIRRIYVASS